MWQRYDWASGDNLFKDDDNGGIDVPMGTFSADGSFSRMMENFEKVRYMCVSN